MSSDNSPTVAKLRTALDPYWKQLNQATQNAIVEVVAEIKQLSQPPLPDDPPRFSEARYVAFIKENYHGSLAGPTQTGGPRILWEITVRADTEPDLFGRMAAVEREAITTTPTQPSHPAPSGNGNGGTNKLLKVVVASPGKAEFHCDGMQYPMKDSRGAKMLISLFDPDLPFAEGDFTSEAIFTPANKWSKGRIGDNEVNIYVDWLGKEVGGKKYRDVLRVHG